MLKLRDLVTFGDTASASTALRPRIHLDVSQALWMHFPPYYKFLGFSLPSNQAVAVCVLVQAAEPEEKRPLPSQQDLAEFQSRLAVSWGRWEPLPPECPRNEQRLGYHPGVLGR